MRRALQELGDGTSKLGNSETGHKISNARALLRHRTSNFGRKFGRSMSNMREHAINTRRQRACLPEEDTIERPRRVSVQLIVEDVKEKGDSKILRALARTAAVNAAVLATAVTGGSAGAVGLLTGGAITAKRLGDGVDNEDGREVAKSVAVFGAGTGASMVGQAVAGALMIGVAGASIPVAGAVAFGVGCCSGITAGVLSEWGVDRALGDDTEEVVTNASLPA
eukprot:CAMPEP_0194317188 /NCGR_PEP_ID=MMETSP0171-20130528/13938_1 /TAXON_ID=218684 /ORGANISM="Corethron pennatum, Strain L29A3" /LENGTH=222 /DNA_ID=CAMNT_0039073687 /DNA_START=116 /DNA_END=781 /DNA_ORIENTATION=+